jgi:formate hydrogenlyase transcriptional activator
MGNASIASTALGGFSETSFPNVGWHDDQQLFLESQINSEISPKKAAFVLDPNELQTARTDVQFRTSRFEFLLNLTRRITSNLAIEELLSFSAASIHALMRPDAIAIGVTEPASMQFKMYTPMPSRNGSSNVRGVFSVAGSAVQQAFDTLRAVIIDDPDSDQFGRLLRELQSGHALQSMCLIPLVIRGRAVGILAVGRATATPLTGEDLEFLTQVAGQIGIGIENAQAFQEISELKNKLAQEKVSLQEEIRSEPGFEQIIGTSAALRHVLQMVETVAPSDSTVLLLGETGTGKELIARAIHQRSRRSERTFVKLNCAAIPTGLLESELFGHEKGAFTGAISQRVGRMELADQGTLFLDEVGDIPIEVQPKLLRALQEREFERLGSIHTRKVNIRLVAATNRDLETMVADREFRSDLYYRLNVFPIRIPPLRERNEDIPLLVRHFVQKFSKQMQKDIETIPAAVMKGLREWDWPGNIRELENFVERSVILTRGRALEAPLSELRRTCTDRSASRPESTIQTNFAEIVKETLHALDRKKNAEEQRTKCEREEIIRALTETKGRVGGIDGAAARMGISRTTLIYRMKRFRIEPGEFAIAKLAAL